MFQAMYTLVSNDMVCRYETLPLLLGTFRSCYPLSYPIYLSTPYPALRDYFVCTVAPSTNLRHRRERSQDHEQLKEKKPGQLPYIFLLFEQIWADVAKCYHSSCFHGK
jgi:hypothetical protein